MSNISDWVIKSLKSLGADHIFMIVGGNAMYIDDAVRTQGLPYTIFHHEQAAAMAAEAYAKVTGKMAVCVVTSGPGASNLLTGMAGAYVDSVPVFFLAGQSKSTEMVREEMRPGVRQFGTFELPNSEVFKPVTKASHSMRFGENPIELVNRLAALTISGRPGPVFLEIPIDVQGETFEPTGRETRILPMPFTPNPSTKDFIVEFYKALQQSKSPLILAGNGVGVARGHEMLAALSRKFSIPVVTTQLAKELLPYEDSNFVGHVGLRGDRAGNLAIFESDLLLCIGTSLQQQTIGYDPEKFAEKSRKFVVDFEGSVSKKKLPIEIERFIDIDVISILEALLTLAPIESVSTDHAVWANLNQERKQALTVRSDPHDVSTPQINMYDFIDSLSKATNEGDLIVTDAGLSWYVMGQAFLLKKGQRFITSGGLGAMGYAIPASIGVSLTHRGRTICVTGDGSAHFNIQELATIVGNQCEVIIFIVNNSGYASIRNTQKAFFSTDYIGTTKESGLYFPDWEKIAKAYGIDFLKIGEKAGLLDGIALALKGKGPLLVEVVCQVDQVIMPAVSSHRDESGALIADPIHVMSPSLGSKDHIVHLN